MTQISAKIIADSKMELTYAHMGNGVTWWIKETNNIVAHISYDRKISWREYAYILNLNQKNEIINFALNKNIPISTTQSEIMALKNIT